MELIRRSAYVGPAGSDIHAIECQGGCTGQARVANVGRSKVRQVQIIRRTQKRRKHKRRRGQIETNRLRTVLWHGGTPLW